MRNKFKVISLLLSLSTLTLSGCVGGSVSSSSSVEDSGSSVITSSISTSEITSEKTSEKTSETSKSSEPEVIYSAEEVIQDICSELFGSAVIEENYFSDGGDGFYTGVSFGNYGSEYLELAVTTVVGILPEYCVEVSPATAGTWEDGEEGYFAVYASEDYSVGIEIGSYIYNDNLCAQINVYPVTE